MIPSPSPSCAAPAATVAPTHKPWVQTAMHGAVFRIALNRPEARNPLGTDMLVALSQALDRAEQTPAVRAIVLTAAGKAFSAGGDLASMGQRLAAPPLAQGQDPIAAGNRQYGAFLTRLSQSPKVTVACVQGAAMGGGAGLACAVDITIGAPSARFGFPEACIGLVPGQILPFVTARIGAQAARRLMLTGERIPAIEAHRIGLLDYLADSDSGLLERTVTVLEHIVGTAPGASAMTKHLLAQTLAAGSALPTKLAPYLDAASAAFALQMRSEALEGVAAAQEKRRAAWNTPVQMPELTDPC